jgi:nucleoside-diphosphate-sugar epimerase
VIQPKRVLITGAGGFIGRWSVRPLLDKGFEVHAVLSAAAGRAPPVQIQGATLHVADLLDEPQIDALIKDVMPSHLLHFAWLATPGVYWQSPENFRWLSAGQHLLRQFSAHGGRRAVLAGSCAEYDWSQVGVCEELGSPMADESAGGLSPYAACKIALQKSLLDIAGKGHLSTAWGRIFFQFGPWEHTERLVPSVIRSLLADQEALCTHGRQVRSFLHVADVGAAFASLLDSDVEGPVNIGSDERVTVADLIDRIAQQIGRPELVRLGARAAPTAEPKILLPDIRRLRDEVQWRPRFTLNHALSDSIAWWRARS